MAESSWSNPWKLTTIGVALVAATAVVTGLVVANRSGDPEPAGPGAYQLGGAIRHHFRTIGHPP